MRSRHGILAVLLIATSPVVALAQMETEPNDSSGTANALAIAEGGATLVQATLTSGDEDVFSVALTARDVLSVMTAPLEGQLDVPDTELVIVDTDGSTELRENDDAGSDFPAGNQFGSAVRFRVPASGTYFIKVEGFTASDVGPYAMVVSREVEIASTTLDTEPTNNTTGGADDPGASVGNGTLIVAALGAGAPDQDHFAVQLNQGQVLLAMTSPVGDLPTSFGVPDTELDVLDSGGSSLVFNEDAGTDLPAPQPYGSVVRLRAPSDGTYYVRVSPYAEASGPYFLTLGIAPAPALTIPALSPLGLGALGLLLALVGWLAVARMRH